jgi:hypothetical protein
MNGVAKRHPRRDQVSFLEQSVAHRRRGYRVFALNGVG